MALENQATEESLKAVFGNVLGRENTSFGILVAYREGDKVRSVLGMPYKMDREKLIVGPYMINGASPRPEDFSTRAIQIPVSNIIGYKKIRLSKIPLQRQT